MGIFSNIQDDISAETIEGVKYIEETYQCRLFKESVGEEQLIDVSEVELADAIEIAEMHQKENEDLVKERTHQFVTAAGIMSGSVGIGNLPVGLSLPGLAGGLFYLYGKLFSKEVEMRKWIIDNGAYTEITGNKWVDNWRYQWNIRFYYTKFLFQVFSTWMIYELSPTFHRLTIEYKLSQTAGNSFRELVEEMGEKYRGKTGFNRFQEEEESFPLEYRDYGKYFEESGDGEKGGE